MHYDMWFESRIQNVVFPTDRIKSTFENLDMRDDQKETSYAMQSFLFPRKHAPHDISGPTETKQQSPQSTEEPKG